MTDEVDGIAAKVFQSLRSRARVDFHGNTQSLMVVYGTESFLRRLAISDYASQLVLKGGMLMAANNIRHMTKDGDFSARGVDNDADAVTDMVASILRLTPDPHDGVVFNAASIRPEVMREDDEYHGIRCNAKGILGKAVIPLSLDISFGDAGESEPITIDSVIDRPGVNVLAYPLELNLAEKVVTAMQRGAANTRDRDFADLSVASHIHPIDAAVLRKHIVAVAEKRDQPLITMAEAFREMPDRQASYVAMLERMSYLAEPPQSWVDALEEVAVLLDPLIEDQDARLRTWLPAERRWTS